MTNMGGISHSENFEDGAARVGDVGERVPCEGEVLDEYEDCVDHMREQCGGVMRDVCSLRHRTLLPMTNAPTRTRTIDSRKTTVATTRTGLNIYSENQRAHGM